MYSKNKSNTIYNHILEWVGDFMIRSKLTIIPFLSIMLLAGCSGNITYNIQNQLSDEFTGDDAVEIVRDYYGEDEDIFFVYVNEPKYIEGKKVYPVCVKSEKQMEIGGSGTVSVLKVNEEGQIIN